MSAFLVIKTSFTDWHCLKKAIVDIGFSIDKQQFHQEAQHLYGYHNDVRPDKANLIIHRKWIGASSNDIGFIKGIDGKIKAIISEYDQNSMGYNKQWLNKLKMHYNAHVVQAKYSEQGWACKKSVAKNGDIVMEITK